MEQFKNEVDRANVLLLNKGPVKYFGILAYGLAKHIMTKEENIKKLGLPCAGFTDGRSITYIVDDAATYKILLGITVHEVLHIISSHLSRRECRIPELWNLAADHVVNRVCNQLERQESYLEMPKERVFFNDLENDFKRDNNREITAEEVYIYLQKNAKVIDGGNSTESGQGGSPGRKRFQVRVKKDKTGNKYLEVTDTKTGEKFKASLDTDPDNATSAETDTATADILSKARMLWESNVISKGDLPGEIVDYLDDVFEVKIAWEEILEIAIMYYAQAQDLPSWTRRNIYIRNVRLPGYVNGFDTQSLICVIDSSGSISNSDLKKFIGVILGSIKHFKKLTILVHDVNVQQEFILDNEPNQDDILRALKEIAGRGGTSHDPVFQRIEEMNREDLISAVIFLTDFYSDVESVYKKYEWITEIPTVWVLNTEGRTQEVELGDCETRTIHIKE